MVSYSGTFFNCFLQKDRYFFPSPPLSCRISVFLRKPAVWRSKKEAGQMPSADAVQSGPCFMKCTSLPCEQYSIFLFIRPEDSLYLPLFFHSAQRNCFMTVLFLPFPVFLLLLRPVPHADIRTAEARFPPESGWFCKPSPCRWWNPFWIPRSILPCSCSILSLKSLRKSPFSAV